MVSLAFSIYWICVNPEGFLVYLASIDLISWDHISHLMLSGTKNCECYNFSLWDVLWWGIMFLINWKIRQVKEPAWMLCSDKSPAEPSIKINTIKYTSIRKEKALGCSDILFISGQVQTYPEYSGYILCLMRRVFANGPGDRDSIPGRVIPKTKNGTWCRLA